MSELSERLAKQDASAVHELFATTEPERIVELVAATTDGELSGLLAEPGLRETVVGQILARLHEYAVPERLARIRGLVCLDLHGPDGGRDRHLLRFAEGRVAGVDAPGDRGGDGAAPDVTIRTGALSFVRMVTGGANAALLLLSGTLGVEGDAMLALAVGAVFPVPGSDAVAVDPTALDPVDVATAVTGTHVDHLTEVMSGGFRPVVLDEIFRRFPEFLDAGKAERASLCVGFRLTGRPDGEVDRYVVSVDHGECRVGDGAGPHGGAEETAGRKRDATITVSGADFLRLATGNLSPVLGVVRGNLKVKGDRTKALELSGIMRIPQARE